jgi:hypothetical protein
MHMVRFLHTSIKALRILRFSTHCLLWVPSPSTGSDHEPHLKVAGVGRGGANKTTQFNLEPTVPTPDQSNLPVPARRRDKDYVSKIDNFSRQGDSCLAVLSQTPVLEELVAKKGHSLRSGLVCHLREHPNWLPA